MENPKQKRLLGSEENIDEYKVMIIFSWKASISR